MHRNEFEKLYVHNHHHSLTCAEIELSHRLRSGWDSFDHGRTCADTVKTVCLENAQEDISHFFFLLKYAYSGYPYFSARCDFDHLKSGLIDKLSSQSASSISSLDLCKLLHQTLSPFIIDGHIVVSCADFEGTFLQAYNPYVTDVIVEK